MSLVSHCSPAAWALGLQSSFRLSELNFIISKLELLVLHISLVSSEGRIRWAEYIDGASQSESERGAPLDGELG